MLFHQFSIGYSLINLIIASILLFKLRKSIISYFYFACVMFLISFAATSYGMVLLEPGILTGALDRVIIFIYSLFPFFFLHFVIVFLGFEKVVQQKRIILAIYFTGFFIYTMVLLNLIPTPVPINGKISTNASIFFITWMSILFTLGIAQLYTMVGGFSHSGVKSKLLFTGFALLFLILPGPFAETILSKVFNQTREWYYLFSVAALVIAVFSIFRYKTSLTFHDSLKSIFSIMRDIIIKTDKYLKIEMIKGAITPLLGYDENELIGKPITDFFEDDEYMMGYREFTLMKKMQVGYFDVEMIHKNGKKITLNFSFSPVIDNDIITGYVGIARDISKRIDYEKEILKAKEEAEVSEKLKTEFLAQISHEIRSPINTILNFVSLLKDEFENKLDVELFDSFQIINHAGKRIVRTIDLILNMSEIQTGTYHCVHHKINLLEDVIDNLFMEYQPRAKEKKLFFEIINGTDNPNIIADLYSTTQIFSNLIDNAIKYTQEGGINIIVKSDDNGNVIVEVIDTGIGIGNDYIQNIFHPFTQEEQGYSRKFEGCGLGLALVNKYCDLNDAEMYVESEKGIGSKFTITFVNHVDKKVDKTQNNTVNRIIQN